MMANKTQNGSQALPRSAKLGAEKLSPEEQKRRFVEAARDAECSEDEADFDAALKKIAKPKREA